MLRNHIDTSSGNVTIAISGSSQSMMHSLVLDSLQPLFGRSTELLRLTPMSIGWMAQALSVETAEAAVEAWAVIGGVPRYWELFQGRAFWEAVAEQILDPQGPLHREPERLLRDELTDHRRAASILTLVGAGCHRLSEIAGRLGVPSSDLSRPIRLLLDVGFLALEVPFERSQRDTRRTLYRIADPFLRFWFHFVEPNRSQLEAGNLDLVLARVRSTFPGFVGPVWEDLARASVPRLGRFAGNYQPAARWWGSTPAGPVELDVVARHTDGQRLLVAEAKRTAQLSEVDGLLRDLETRAARVPELAGQPREAVLFVLNGGTNAWSHPRVIGPAEVIEALGGEAWSERRTDVRPKDP
ncbi:MAG: ATP-binding protein [Myxococcales bacterium]|nr:ATP-binding protein [Myxococcales bacterium]